MMFTKIPKHTFCNTTLKKLLYVVLINIGLMNSSCASNKVPLDDIKQLQWQHRVLIVWAESPVYTLKTLLKTAAFEIEDRDMIIFAVNDSKLETNYNGAVTANFQKMLINTFPKSKAQYFLIGKDGGLKMTGQQLNITDVFDEIDTMPMRQWEMR